LAGVGSVKVLPLSVNEESLLFLNPLSERLEVPEHSGLALKNLLEFLFRVLAGSLYFISKHIVNGGEAGFDGLDIFLFNPTVDHGIGEYLQGCVLHSGTEAGHTLEAVINQLLTLLGVLHDVKAFIRVEHISKELQAHEIKIG